MKTKTLLLITIFLLLIAPSIVWLFWEFPILITYKVIIMSLILFLLPGMAITVFLKNLRLIERACIGLATGLTINSIILYLLNKVGLPINWVVVIALEVLFGILLIKYRKKITIGIDYSDIIAIFISLIAFFILTIPIFSYPTPYGEADAGWHYYLSEYVRTNEKIPEDYPPFSHFYANEKYGYPPATHINIAIIGTLANVPHMYAAYLYVAFLHLILVLGVYCFVRKYFGKIEAIGASLFSIFMLRFLLTALWGQWPFFTSLAMFPVSLLLITRYFENRTKENAIFAGAFIGLEIWAHTQIAIHSTLLLLLFGVFWLIKNRRFPEKFYFLLIAAVIVLPIIFEPQVIDVTSFREQDVGFYLWYPPVNELGFVGGYPSSWVDPFAMYSYVWMLAIFGLIIWWWFYKTNYMIPIFILSLAILFHLPNVTIGRIVRILVDEAIIISILGGIGLGFYKVFKEIEKYWWLGIILMFVILYFQISSVLPYLNISPPARLSEYQYEFLLDMRDLPEGKIAILGLESWALHSSWAPQLSEHVSYHVDIKQSGEIIQISFQNETKYVFLTRAALPADFGNFVSIVMNNVKGMGCEVLKTDSNSMLLTGECVSGKTITI